MDIFSLFLEKGDFFMKQTSTYNIKRLTALAMLAALSFAVHFIHIPVMFLNLDFKDVIMAVGGMYFGPLSGLALAILVPVLEFFMSDGTGVYGLIMNWISSITFVCVASIIYRFRKTLSGAVIALISAALAMTAVMICANLLVTPYYMGVSVAEVGALIPKLLLPFNATKGILNASITLCVYKPITKILLRTGFGKRSTIGIIQAPTQNKKHTVLVWIIGGSVAVISLCIIFFVLGGHLAFS